MHAKIAAASQGEAAAGRRPRSAGEAAAEEAAFQQVGGRGSSSLRGGGVGLFAATGRGV